MSNTVNVERFNGYTRQWETLLTNVAADEADSVVAKLAQYGSTCYRVDDTDATTGPLATAIRDAEADVRMEGFLDTVETEMEGWGEVDGGGWTAPGEWADVVAELHLDLVIIGFDIDGARDAFFEVWTPEVINHLAFELDHAFDPE